MATTAETLAKVNAAIDALASDPPVDYREGDVTIKHSQKMAQLLKMRKELMATPESDFDILTFHSDINEFGIDSTQYI